MHPVDWAVVVAFIAWIVYDGLKRTKDSDELEGYFLAKRSIPWWAAGISVMATQLSAITMIGTTGQGYTDGLRFIQFYFALPLAMIILSVTLVPFFYNSGVYTAYEYLERRFDREDAQLHQPPVPALARHGLRRRRVGAGRRAVAGARLGPGRDVAADHRARGRLHDVRRRAGRHVDRREDHGAHRARARRDGRGGDHRPARRASASATASSIAAATGRLETFDFSFDLTNQYTFWSGTIAALFLFCSYFGTDQSQVQRYLTARSVDEARHSLLMSAYWKIPLQFLVLFLGVLVFVFYIFTPPPVLFSKVHAERLQRGGARRPAYAALETEFDAAIRRAPRRRRPAWRGARGSGDAAALDAAKASMREREAALQAVRGRAATLVQETGERRFSDTNYIIPNFILTQLPDRPDRAAHRRDHHGGDRHDRRRAQLAVDRHRHRFLQARLAHRRHRRALPDACRRSPPGCGASSPAASPSGRRSSAR